MNNIYKDQLEILQKRIPIGLRHGLTLLEKTNGNVEKAEEYFRNEMVALTVNKTNVTSEIASRHLVKNNFDIGLTIKSIDEERYTLTELIVRKYGNRKEEALEKVMYAIEETHSIERQFWLNFQDLKELSGEAFCLLTIMEWINYEDYESFEIALTFELETVTQQLEDKLALPELADSLRRAGEIQKVLYEKNKIDKGIENYIKATNQLRENKEYQKYETTYQEQRSLLIDSLYECVTANIDKFP
ncbi:hypothetical protein [Chryseobacterium sp. Mn2064]|uniref:hypothetical protein n=1 Tax=Chryseobacterium sp. Mn2064 TaxID=3395263 RepID=UPI003BDB38CF